MTNPGGSEIMCVVRMVRMVRFKNDLGASRIRS
jgi:hypothetical protein